ncbi:MAG TPA: mannitol dehydrogenase family protein, partial [Lachnospiraceae bacterium]|nr:mannitol dehydrogenase family protein [Lachnospiraceae bacterium]
LLPDVAADLKAGPDCPSTYMGRITAMLLARYKKNKAPLAMVSMDNCSHNGDKLKSVITCFARAWGEEGFLRWLEESVSFPWSMIDKITPGPADAVAAMLEKDQLPADTPFVNAEESEYLVIEDDFPNGRPCLEKAGIYFTDRETVDKVERMKVCTCLNPLHTALAVFGCLLGYRHVWQEMQDEDLRKMVEIIGYREGLPVVTDPGIIKPQEFIDTVVHERIPNPFLPDTPQRIAMDTSQKLPIRFGETIKAYLASDRLEVQDLRLIPLVHAGWLRYLMAVDDNGNAFERSPDPLLEAAGSYVSSFRLGEKPDAGALEPLLRNASIFGVDLVEAGLSEKVTGYLEKLMAGTGAVRRTLHETVIKAEANL